MNLVNKVANRYIKASMESTLQKMQNMFIVNSHLYHEQAFEGYDDTIMINVLWDNDLSTPWSYEGDPYHLPKPIAVLTTSPATGREKETEEKMIENWFGSVGEVTSLGYAPDDLWDLWEKDRDFEFHSWEVNLEQFNELKKKYPTLFSNKMDLSWKNGPK